jgi:hypothetical protein
MVVPLDYETPQPPTGTTWDAFTGVIIGLLMWGMSGLIYGAIEGLSGPVASNVLNIVAIVLSFVIAAIATIGIVLQKDKTPPMTGFLSGTIFIGFLLCVVSLLVMIMR